LARARIDRQLRELTALFRPPSWLTCFAAWRCITKEEKGRGRRGEPERRMVEREIYGKEK